MFTKFFIWFYVTFIGIRFFKLSKKPIIKEYLKAIAVTHDNRRVTFNFYNTLHGVYTYKRRTASRKYVKALLFYAEFDSSFPDEYKEYNNLVFISPGIITYFYKEKMVSKLLIKAYLSYISQLKEQIDKEDADSIFGKGGIN